MPGLVCSVPVCAGDFHMLAPREVESSQSRPLRRQLPRLMMPPEGLDTQNLHISIERLVVQRPAPHVFTRIPGPVAKVPGLVSFSTRSVPGMTTCSPPPAGRGLRAKAPLTASAGATRPRATAHSTKAATLASLSPDFRRTCVSAPARAPWPSRPPVRAARTAAGELSWSGSWRALAPSVRRVKLKPTPVPPVPISGATPWFTVCCVRRDFLVWHILPNGLVCIWRGSAT